MKFYVNFFPLAMYPKVGLLGDMTVTFLISGGTSILFFMLVVPVYMPTSSMKVPVAPQPHHILGIVSRLKFNDYVVTSHYSYNLNFLDDLRFEYTFICLLIIHIFCEIIY